MSFPISHLGIKLFILGVVIRKPKCISNFSTYFSRNEKVNGDKALTYTLFMQEKNWEAEEQAEDI